eukprot:569465-Pyramimonas_sp.AAC.1
MDKLPAKFRWTFAYVLSVCCTLAFAKIVLDDLSELRGQGPRDIIRHVAAKMSHPCQMFAVHSVYSKVRHSEWKSLSKEEALYHSARHDASVAESIDHLPSEMGTVVCAQKLSC